MNPNKTSEVKPLKCWARLVKGQIKVDELGTHYSGVDGYIQVEIRPIQEDRQVEENKVCPHIVTGKEGTSYCDLGESSYVEQQKKIEALQEENKKLNLEIGQLKLDLLAYELPVKEDRQVEELTWKEKHGQVTNELSETGGRLMMQSFKNADLEKEKEALQERVREMNLKMDVAQKLIEEYSSLYPTAYRYGRIKTYTQLFEQKLSQPEQKKSSMSSEAKQEK